MTEKVPGFAAKRLTGESRAEAPLDFAPPTTNKEGTTCTPEENQLTNVD